MMMIVAPHQAANYAAYRSRIRSFANRDHSNTGNGCCLMRQLQAHRCKSLQVVASRPQDDDSAIIYIQIRVSGSRQDDDKITSAL